MSYTSMLHSPQGCTYIVDHEMHDGLGHEIPHSLVDNGHVRVYQVPNGLHLALQLRVHRVHEAVGAVLLRLTGLPLGTQGITVWQGLCNQTPGVTKISDLSPCKGASRTEALRATQGSRSLCASKDPDSPHSALTRL